VFSCPKIAGGGQASRLSKLLENKGYEVFRVDRIEDGQVWASDGAYLGEVVEGNYILRRTNMIPPLPKIPRILPIRPIRAIQEISRSGRIPKAGWIDALEGFKQT
jgi:hypothetical protein